MIHCYSLWCFLVIVINLYKHGGYKKVYIFLGLAWVLLVTTDSQRTFRWGLFAVMGKRDKIVKNNLYEDCKPHCITLQFFKSLLTALLSGIGALAECSTKQNCYGSG